MFVDDEDTKILSERKMKKTELLWNNYFEYLKDEIEQSKLMKRAKDKPMFATGHEQEPHKTTRLEHSKMTANIAKRIAKPLNLNDIYIEIAMLLHDAGHPFDAHEGEEMFNGEAIINNCQYYHHNAEGLYVIEVEKIFRNAINRIPDIKNMPDVEKQLIAEIPYFLDVVISHDGEASPSEMYRKPEEYPDMQTAVDTKLKLATSKNGQYKFTAQTPEGQIAKFADVIAYLATDIEDRFKSGIHEEFPREYLILLGEIFADSYIEDDEKKITIAKNRIEALEKEYITQRVYDTEQNQNIIKKAEKIAEEIINTGIDINDEEIVDEAIDKYLEDYENVLNTKDGDERKKYYSQMIKLRKCIGNFIHARSGVIKAVTIKLQDYFINDLVKNSSNSEYLHFSEPVERAFFQAKQLNYQYIGKAKWHYLEEGHPQATHALVDFLSMSLRRTGVIENFFYDESIREQLEEYPEILNYMRTLNIEQPEYEKYKKAFGIRDVRITNKKYSGGDKDELKACKELFSAAYTYVQESETTFASRFINTFYAIEDQVTCKVDSILGRLSEKDKKARKTHIKFYDDLIQQDEEELREYIIDEYGPIEEITDELREKIISEITHIQRLFMEDKMAKQMAMAYLSGKTDKGFTALAKKTGLISKDRNLFDESTQGTDGSGKVAELRNNMGEQR